MAMKLRLSVKGAKKARFYWIMAADSRMPRETGKEKLGTYNPRLKKEDASRVTLNEDRIRYWLSCGAQPTETVRRLLSKSGFHFENKAS